MGGSADRRRAGMVLGTALLVAACNGGGDAAPTTDTGTAPVSTTNATAIAPTTVATVPPATEPPEETSTTPAPTTTVAPLPELVTRSRLVVTGSEEVVFDWTTDQCEPEHIPDIAPRAYRDADDRVHLTIGHYLTYRMTGPTLDDVATDCSTIQLESDYDPDPSQFNDSEWIGSPYTFDGETIYAVVHNEYRGDTHTAARPGQCPSRRRLPCLDTSFTMQISTDGGDTFDDIVEPPGHMIATLPYQYLDDTVPSGIRQPSNVIEGPDGFFYLFGNVSDQPDERQWVCAMRTDDLSDPRSWRYWDGRGFDGVWRDPYREVVDPNRDKCAPFAENQLVGSIQESVVFDERLGRYVMVGVSARWGQPDEMWGVYYSTSPDLLEWSERELLLQVPVNATVGDPDNDTTHAYPALIDPDSSSMNFSTSDGRLYLYMSRFNFGGNSLDRDLLRWPIEVVDEVVPAPDWTFEAPDDIDPVAGGWFAANDLADPVLSDGVLELRPSGTDPWIENFSVRIPAEYDRLVIRMRLPNGVSNVGQLFFATDTDPDLDEAKSVLFDVSGTGTFIDYELDLSAQAGWSGTITGLRIDPVEGITADADIDRIWFPVAT